jgi:hypothetical protein
MSKYAYKKQQFQLERELVNDKANFVCLKVKKALKSGITEITRDSCLLSEGFNSERKKKERKNKKEGKKGRIRIQNK